MNDLFFDFNKYDLREDTKEKPVPIADEIKKKYPDREIIIKTN